MKRTKKRKEKNERTKERKEKKTKKRMIMIKSLVCIAVVMASAARTVNAKCRALPCDDEEANTRESDCLVRCNCHWNKDGIPGSTQFPRCYAESDTTSISISVHEKYTLYTSVPKTAEHPKAGLPINVGSGTYDEKCTDDMDDSSTWTELSTDLSNYDVEDESAYGEKGNWTTVDWSSFNCT